MDGYYPDFAKKEELRRRRVLGRIRQDWYGRDRGTLENGMRDRLWRIGDLAEDVLQDACPNDETRDFTELNARFEGIAQDWCGMVRLLSLQSGVLTLKLRHRAYRERVTEDLELIRDAVNSVFGRTICETIELQ